MAVRLPKTARSRPRPRRGRVVLGARGLLFKRLGLPRLGLAPDAAASLVAEAPGVPIREIFRRFWPYTRSFRRWMWLTLALLAVVPALETASIWMFKVLVDQVLVPRDVGPFFWVALGYLTITLVRGVVSFVDSYLSTWLGERFLLSLRLDFFAHLQRLSLDFFERRRLGDIVSRLTGDIASIEAFVLSGVSDALSYALRLIFFAGALFYLQWDLAAVPLTEAPLFWFAARRLSKLIKQASRAKRRHAGSITAVAEESLSNIQLVQAYNRQDAERVRFQHENQGAFDATMAATRLRGFFSPLVDLIELLGAMLVVGLGTWKLSKGELSLGGLLVFLTYLNGLYSPIRGLAKLANTIHGASAGAERIIEFLDEQPPVRDLHGARSLERARGRLLLDHVSFRYPGTEVD